MQIETDLTGKLLIAMPGIGDKRFERTVILICAHTPDFAMGIVLNRPMSGIDLQEIIDQMDVPQEAELDGVTVLEGGPVATERGFVLHTDDVICEGATMEVDDELCMTATREILAAVASASPPRNFVMALGYAGWGAGQLEQELAQNAWLVSAPDSDLVFGEAHEHKWRHALTRMGVDLSRLQSDAGNA
ncbi:YqgE/AlgH family protein [Hyphomonas sp. WL0036]|uniref:YqgE/AlgH family protein n=1 Tax=Hyphomonas sediminis TaxID=2866160 RepID=UPI001C7FDA16|nr:YqgE/AlgH family protein [Hyphomonas sediminis]MBY9067038.1 YqgE/AlgH family protein [Hyphomonas sediminis]